MGVRQVVLAVNKMDLVEWSEAAFRAIEADFAGLADRFGFDDAAAIPVSAVLGDNVAQRSVNMPWYGGPALLEHLQQAPASAGRADDAFRFPVQLVIRDGQDFRGLAGTVASGSIAVGEEVVDAVSARRARVARIAMMGRELASASAGQAVVIGLDRDLDLSRGAVLGVARDAPGVAHGIGRAAGVAVGGALRSRARLPAAHSDRHRAHRLDQRQSPPRPGSVERAARCDLRQQRHRAGAHRSRPQGRARSLRSSARPAASCWSIPFPARPLPAAW
jgi:hypothetical protein